MVSIASITCYHTKTLPSSLVDQALALTALTASSLCSISSICRKTALTLRFLVTDCELRHPSSASWSSPQPALALGPLTQLPCRALADRRRRRGCRAHRAHCATALDAYCRLRAHHATRDKGKSRSRRDARDRCASQLRERVAIMRHPLVAHHLNSISSLLRRHFTEALAVGIGILKVAKLPSISGMLTAYCRRRLVKS